MILIGIVGTERHHHPPTDQFASPQPLKKSPKKPTFRQTRQPLPSRSSGKTRVVGRKAEQEEEGFFFFFGLDTLVSRLTLCWSAWGGGKGGGGEKNVMSTLAYFSCFCPGFLSPDKLLSFSK